MRAPRPRADGLEPGDVVDCTDCGANVKTYTYSRRLVTFERSFRLPDGRRVCSVCKIRRAAWAIVRDLVAGRDVRTLRARARRLLGRRAS